MSEILNNIKLLHEKYGDKIKSECHLILLYMKDIDGVSVDKTAIDTSDFLTKSTCISKILQNYSMYKILEEENE